MVEEEALKVVSEVVAAVASTCVWDTREVAWEVSVATELTMHWAVEMPWQARSKGDHCQPSWHRVAARKPV